MSASEKLSADKLAKLSNLELAHISQEITGRLNNADWQQVVADLRGSGHIHTFGDSAPPILQKFLKLEIDLDKELGKQSATAPLMSNISLDPRRPRGDEERVVALLSSQDEGAHMRMEIHPQYDLTTVAFGIKSMLTLRFNLPHLDLDESNKFLELMRRDRGLAFLWTPDRWEKDFLIFVKGDVFTRVYAFSTTIEAAARITKETMGTMTDWLEKAWFPRQRKPRFKRGTQALPSLSAELMERITPLPVPASTSLVPALPDEALDGVIHALVKLDMMGRGGLIAVAGDKVEILGKIFAAPSPEAIKAELRAHPDLLERIRAKLLPDSQPVGAISPLPKKDPDLDTW